MSEQIYKGKVYELNPHNLKEYLRALAILEAAKLEQAAPETMAYWTAADRIAELEQQANEKCACRFVDGAWVEKCEFHVLGNPYSRLKTTNEQPPAGDERGHYSKTGDTVAEKLARLLKNEACSVTIFPENADFRGADYAIEFEDILAKFPSTRFEGDTLDECLDKAIAALKEANGKP